MKRFFLALMLLVPLHMASAQPPYLPTQLCDVDLTQWDEVERTNFRYTSEWILIGRSSVFRTLFTYPDLIELGTISMSDSDEIISISKHDFNSDDEIELLVRHTNSVTQNQSYYVIDFESNTTLFAFEESGGTVEEQAGFYMFDAEEQERLGFVWAFLFIPPEGDRTLRLYTLTPDSEQFQMIAEQSFSSDYEVENVGQFLLDTDPGLEVLLRLNSGDHYLSALGLLGFNMEDGAVIWEIPERELPFNLSWITARSGTNVLGKVYYELTTPLEDHTDLYEVWGFSFDESTSRVPYPLVADKVIVDSKGTPASPQKLFSIERPSNHAQQSQTPHTLHLDPQLGRMNVHQSELLNGRIK